MSHLENFPKRCDNRRIQEQSESAFPAGISACENFVVQSTDRQDYGTDYLIEAIDAGEMTNVRVCVQVTGTGCKQNKDEPISVPIRREPLNYLTVQPASPIHV